MSSSDFAQTDPGREGSILPGRPEPGTQSPTPDPSDEYPIGERLQRDPSNLGDDVTGQGDLTYPTPDPPTNNI